MPRKPRRRDPVTVRVMMPPPDERTALGRELATLRARIAAEAGVEATRLEVCWPGDPAYDAAPRGAHVLRWRDADPRTAHRACAATGPTAPHQERDE